MRFLRRSLAGCALALGLSTLGFSQATTGSLSGVITDPNGAAVPNATVVAAHERTGVRTETRTTEAGLYVFPSLPVGPYNVSIEKAGFRRLARSGIEIRAITRQQLDLQLEVGDVLQTVEVTAEAPLLETVSPQRGQVVSSQMMNNLPLFSGGIRNAQAFVGYMPGVSRGTPELSISGSGGRASKFSLMARASRFRSPAGWCSTSLAPKCSANSNSSPAPTTPSTAASAAVCRSS
jgi:hypothetical protein